MARESRHGVPDSERLSGEKTTGRAVGAEDHEIHWAGPSFIGSLLKVSLINQLIG